MKLAPNARHLHRAWSVRFMALAILAWISAALDTACGFACGALPVSPFWLGAAAGGLNLAALVSRYFYQENLH
jgi:hypothetical protein